MDDKKYIIRRRHVMANIQPVKNGALYIRVSTHLQEELSPDAQNACLWNMQKLITSLY